MQSSLFGCNTTQCVQALVLFCENGLHHKKCITNASGKIFHNRIASLKKIKAAD